MHDLVVVGRGALGARRGGLRAPRRGSTCWCSRPAPPAARRARARASRTTWASPRASPARTWRAARFVQAEKFGANLAVARAAVRPGLRRPAATASRAPTAAAVQGNAVVVATGASVPQADRARARAFEGTGVYYGATHVEAQLCGGEEVVVVGGGNSAGQAAVFLSGIARHVHVLVRGDGLADSMSRYLSAASRRARPSRSGPTREIEALEGDGRLERVAWRTARAARPRGARHPPRLLDDGRRPEHALARRLRGARRAALRQDRRGPRGRGAGGRALAPEAPALSVRDEPAGRVRGGRRARRAA